MKAIETTGCSCTSPTFWLAYGAKMRKKQSTGILMLLRGMMGGSK